MSTIGLTLILQVLAWSGDTESAQPANQPRAQLCHPIEFYTSDNCRQCEAAERFLNALAVRRPDVRITRRDVAKDRQALQQLHEICRQRKIEKVGIPGVLVAKQFFLGFQGDETTGRHIEELLTIEIFTREGCPHCHKAKAFAHDLVTRYPGLSIVVRDVVKDPAALERMHDLARRHHVQVPNLPLFQIYGHVTVGFVDAESTGRDLEKMIRGATTPCPAARAAPQPGNVPRRTSPPEGSSRSAPQTKAQVFRGRSRWAVPPMAMLHLFTEPAGERGNTAPPELPETIEIPAEEVQEFQEPAAAPSEPPNEITIPVLGTLRVADVGMPMFTFILGLVDGFNPCAMWVLIFLLSMLANLKDRRKMLAIAGTFVAVSGIAYFSFMAAWLNVFMLIGFARWAQIGLGLLAIVIGAVNVKDFFAFGRGCSFSIPESAKPGIYARVRHILAAKYLAAAIMGASVLAILVNMIELLCTAGIPALYTQILAFQQYPWWKNYLYLGLYNVAYMFDDVIMLTIAVVTLSHRKLQEKEGRWLKLVSGLVILALGVLLLFKPDWLA